MNLIAHYWGGVLISTLLTVIPAPPAESNRAEFTLAGYVPNDVFLFVAGRHNPERDFLDRYWDEVFTALRQSGVGTDLLELLGTLFQGDQKAEFMRLKDRATQLLAGVDWEQLAGKEMVFAERLAQPLKIGGQGVAVMPQMVWLLRGTPEGAAQNFTGLEAILGAIVEEINRLSGAEALALERGQRHGASVTTMSLTAWASEVPAAPAALALRDDIIIIAVGEPLLDDVLELINKSGSKTAVGADPRFKAAFAKLPQAEDSMTFFDMQALATSMQTMMEGVFSVAGAPKDLPLDWSMEPKASALTSQAIQAYRQRDYAQALACTQKAYEISPKSPIILYNLACFSALNGKPTEALDWLEQAVNAGFYAPTKISTDSDLESLRDEPRYKAALARAGELADEYRAEDVIENSAKTGEAYQLHLQAWQAYEQKEYEQGLKLAEQAFAVAPQDSRVLYDLACFHALLGHTSTALDYLEKAVAGGFYCPRHIAKDPDLESLRGSERFAAALANARKQAAARGARSATDELSVVRHFLDRVTSTMRIMDYAATVERTEGYATHMESLAVLVSDARKNPFYAVLGQRPPVTDCTHYLPEETASFSVSSGVDCGALYRFLEDSVRAAGPVGEEMLQKWAEIQKQIGVDVQRDVVAWLDGQFISVTLDGERGSVWLVKVKDEETARSKVGAALGFLSTQLSDAIAKQPALAGLAMLAIHTSEIEDPRLTGFQNIHSSFSPQPAVWGVQDGYLMFGSSADAVALCLATARGEHPNVRKNARVMSEALLPDGPVDSVSLADQRGLGEEIAKGIGIVSMVSGMMGAFIPEPSVRPVITRLAGILAKLTPVVRKINFFKSTASETTFDGLAWRTRTVTHYFSPAERPTTAGAR
ncbi:MAG: hypothetical protein KA383_09255 [Phycisphaerae bacterium]|nr:hypothetical protein [Phycisphaerae bacterium]